MWPELPRALQLILYVYCGFWAIWLFTTLFYSDKVRRIFLGTDVSGVSLPLPQVTSPDQGERVEFRSADGIPLAGVFLRARGTPAAAGPVVVFSHPLGVGGGAYAKYADWLLDEGYHVFTFDHRGQGESHNIRGYHPRQWVTEHEVRDMLGAIDHVTARAEVDAGRVVLLGVSRGAGTCLVAASRRPAVRAVLCDSAFSTWHTLQERMRKWAALVLRSEWVGRQVPAFAYFYLGLSTIMLAEVTERVRYSSVVAALRACRARPLAFIHGGRDGYISVNQSRLFSRQYARGQASLLVVKEARHNESVTADPLAYRDFARRFFTESLRSPG